MISHPSRWPWWALGVLGGLAVACLATLIGVSVESESVARILLPGFAVVSLFWPEGVHTDATLGSALSLIIGLAVNVVLVAAATAVLIAGLGRLLARRAIAIRKKQ